MSGSSLLPEIVTFPGIRLAGFKAKMSLAADQTVPLWKSFMPGRKQIPGVVSEELYSVRIYPADYFAVLNPGREFEKWAAAPVDPHMAIPKPWELLQIPTGLYAVFHYRGLNTDPSIYRYIYGSWLPASGYVPDVRPHFEILGARYRNNDPQSEEDIWIPVTRS